MEFNENSVLLFNITDLVENVKNVFVALCSFLKIYSSDTNSTYLVDPHFW